MQTNRSPQLEHPERKAARPISVPVEKTKESSPLIIHQHGQRQ